MQKRSLLILAIALTLVIGASVAVPTLGTTVQAKPCTPGGSIDLHDVPCETTPAINFYTVTGTRVHVAPNQVVIADATCNPGDQVTGGGYTATSTFGAVSIFSSFPADDSTWRVPIYNDDFTSTEFYVTAWARCADLDP